MSIAARIVPPVSIVIRWPEKISADAPKQLARRLAAGKTSATWAVEQPRQFAVLNDTVGKATAFEAALLAREAPAAALGEWVSSSLARFDAASVSIGALAVSDDLRRGKWERTLCQAGIRAVIGGAVRAKATGVRSLPFGIVEFAPHVEAPLERRWWPFGGVSRQLDFSKLTTRAVINIELSRIELTGARSLRTIEQLIEQVSEAVGDGVVRLVAISQMASELSRQPVTRPQRSILRAAA